MARTPRTMRAAVVGALALLWVAPSSTAAADAQPAFIAVDAHWLTTVNYFREMAGLGPVTEDPNLSAGAVLHSCYMLANGLTHDEVPGQPGYSVEGEAAGENGNVAVSTGYGTSARRHIELWMTGPFHAIGVLRPNLHTVGFGKCDSQTTPKWHSGATLDVLRGLGEKTPLDAPVLFPGDGSTTSLSKFIVETPDPLAFCGWPASGGAGLPVIAMMPEPVGGTVTASITGPSGPLQTCALSELNTSGTAKTIVQQENAVVAIPRNALAPGTYTVTITTGARTVSWSFTVDPAAALGTAPLSQAQPVGVPVGFDPLTPTRVVDTRESLGGTRLTGGVMKRLQIAGTGGVPVDADAVSANFTVVDPSVAGYLTVWNCSPERPVVSTSNFGGGDVTPNAATIPLDGSGGLCAYSNTSADLIVDVNGAYSTDGSSRFSSVVPTRLIDTRDNGNRLHGGQTVELQVGGVAGVPADASAVTLNITSVDPSQRGYVTAYACEDERPPISSLNPQPGRVRPNLVVTPVSASGTVCVYSLQDVDLVIDVTGYLRQGSGERFTPSRPFRLTDTRESSRPDLHAGTGGSPVPASGTLVIQVAGARGVPADATAVSLNLTVTGASSAGYLTAWPCGERPTTSTANYEQSDAVSNGAQLPLSPTGALCVFSMEDAHVIIDVNGWWS
jgi:hypothetical protein